MINNILRRQIIENGWIEIDFSSDLPLSILAKTLGTIMPQSRGSQIIKLTQKEKSEISNSLSSKFGFDEFPLHVDGVGLPIPPSIILMRSMNDDYSNQPTIISCIKLPKENEPEYEQLASNIITFNIGKYSFYSPILNKKTSDRDEFIRYNPSCMLSSDNSIINRLIRNASKNEVYWENGKVIAIYNYRVLHGRGIAKNRENIGKRILERCWIR